MSMFPNASRALRAESGDRGRAGGSVLPSRTPMRADKASTAGEDAGGSEVDPAVDGLDGDTETWDIEMDGVYGGGEMEHRRGMTAETGRRRYVA